MKINISSDHFLLKKSDYKELFKIMKICLLFLFAFTFQLMALDSNAQDAIIELKSNSVTVSQLISEIEKQTDYLVVYSNREVNTSREVTLKKKSDKVSEYLHQTFNGTDIGYEFENDYIVLSRKAQETASILTGLVQTAQQQGKTVRGAVTDTNGDPVIGATIVLKGDAAKGTVTGVDGNYILLDLPEDAELEISFVGMQSQSILTQGRTTINVTLIEDVGLLDELVVVGYGTQKKVNLTGAVAHVNSDVIEKRAVANVGQALQGLIPNLNVSISNGKPNTDPSFNIRGATSISGSSFVSGSPYILIDGIEGDINMINPEDIESITVLKDAASAAIYGARAANGVVLVVTKQGLKNKTPKITYSNMFEFRKPTNFPDRLNTYEMALAYNAANEARHAAAKFNDEYLTTIKNYVDNPETAPVYLMDGNVIRWAGNTNPYDEGVRDWAPMQKHNVTVSGGDKKIGYYTSFGYQDQDGIYAYGTDNSKRYNALVNLTTDISDWLEVKLNANFNKRTYKEPSMGGINIWQEFSNFRQAIVPLYTPDYAPEGFRNVPTDLVLGIMEFEKDQRKDENQHIRLAGSLKADIVKGLSFNGEFAYQNKYYYRNSNMLEYNRVFEDWSFTNKGTYPTFSYKTQSNDNYRVLNFFFDYQKTFLEKHNFHALAGFNEELYVSKGFWAEGQELITNSVPFIEATTGQKLAGDNMYEWAVRGAFFRMNYDYLGKYLLEFNGRYDGTSRFAKDSRFAFFPSFSLGWRVSDESFMKWSSPTLTDLKLRASYGSLGNQDVSTYAYINTYGINPRVNYIIDNDRPMGIEPPSLTSADLTWQTTTTMDYGLDATLFNRLNVTFDWYNRHVWDMLTSAGKAPSVLGASMPNKNAGEMQTKGWELSVGWHNTTSYGLKYNISAFAADSYSEITRFDSNPNKLISTLYVGRRMGEIWGYETEGIFQNQEEIDAAANQSFLYGGVWEPGDTHYKDLNDDEKIDNGKGTVDDPGDKKIIGNGSARYQFGLNGAFSWKNFELSFIVQGIGKRDHYIPTSDWVYWGQFVDERGVPTRDFLADSWTEANRDALYPQYKGGASYNIQYQSRLLIDASYIRLKSVTLGYTIPARALNRLPVKGLRFYLSGHNLGELSNVPKQFDPELLSQDYPVMRSYACGLEIRF